MNVLGNKISLVIVCGATAVLGVLYWMKYRKATKVKRIEEKSEDENSSENIVESTDDGTVTSTAPLDSIKSDEDELVKILPIEWKKIGQVKELFIYPLKSGRGRPLKESVFDDLGITANNGELFPIRDRMFVVYKEETGDIKVGKNYPTLVLVTLSAVDQRHVKLEAVGMPCVTFEVPENNGNNLAPVSCLVWWGEELECADCGSEVARWISRFLTGTNNGLRLGCAIGRRKNCSKKESWEIFDGVFATLKTEGTGLQSDLASYMVMSESSVYELNQKLDRPGPALQFRPNVVVSGPEPFAEDNWEWLKIGQNVVIRNVKPYSNYREQRNPQRVQVNGKSPTMGIYCGIYKTGDVKIGDEVYVASVTNKFGGSDTEHFLRKESEKNGHYSNATRLS